MARDYRKRPSDLLHIDDPYTAYCLDEACFLISTRIQNGEAPVFRVQYGSFSALYAEN